jgi:predicted nucleic-acid-binding protein
VVLGEFEWVLSSCYGIPKHALRAALLALFEQPGLVFDDRAAFERALAHFSRSKIEFSDALIGERGRTHGARTTYTFDRVLSRQDAFSPLA